MQISTVKWLCARLWETTVLRDISHLQHSYSGEPQKLVEFSSDDVRPFSRIEGATDFACEDMELSGEGTSNSSILNHCTRIFHYKPPSSWGSPILGNHHTSWEMQCLQVLFQRIDPSDSQEVPPITAHGSIFISAETVIILENPLKNPSDRLEHSHSPDPSFSLEASIWAHLDGGGPNKNGGFFRIIWNDWKSLSISGLSPLWYLCHVCIWVKLATPVLRWTETNRLKSLVTPPILTPCPIYFVCRIMVNHENPLA